MATKTASVVTGGTNQASVTAEELNATGTDFISAGIVGAVTLNTGSGGSGGFAINAQGTPAMSVRISAGVAYVTATPTGGNSQLVRAKMTTFEDVTIAANSTGATRYDWVYLVASATTLANPGANKDDVFTLATSRSTSNTVDNGTPPTYGLNLGYVTVANAASSITNSNITDSRVQAGPSGIKGDLLLTQSAAGSDAKITAVGTDTNISITPTPKGTGLFKLPSGLTAGLVRQRQGGTSGDGAWNTTGTTNTDTSAKSVFIQTGTNTTSGGSITVTFPVAFTQAPVVFVTLVSSANGFWAQLDSAASTTAFTATTWSATGVQVNKLFSWIAIGQ